MKILQTNVTPHEGGIGGYTVELVYEDGNHLSVNLRDEDDEDFNKQDLILRAKALLDDVDASGVRGDMPAYDAHSNETSDPSTKNNPAASDDDSQGGPERPG